MKIVLVGLASRFTEGMTYQDNLLANQLQADGNEVIVISDCYKYCDGFVVPTEEQDEILSNGIRLIRVKYKKIINGFISNKVRAVKGLYKILEELKPDIIFHHSLQSYELLTVAKYKKNNPAVKLYVDNHSDFNNSATNFLSKNILHGMFYKKIAQKSLPYIEKVYFVGYECFDFLKKIYSIPEEIMEYYPLGGIILEESERQEKRKLIRNQLKLDEQDILIIHTGKMDKIKRTEDILKAFVEVQNDKLHLLLIGSLSDGIKQDVMSLISSDKRISFLGWKNGDELLEYLCACDLYLQPGSQSATMQNAICSGSAAALYPHPSHKYLLDDSVFYVETIEDMKLLFKELLENREELERKRAHSIKIAQEVLDYKMLAARLYK